MERKKKRLILLIALLASPLLVFVVCFVIDFVSHVISVSKHQTYHEQFRDNRFLDKLDSKYAEESIVLLVYSKSPLVKAVRQRRHRLFSSSPRFFEVKWRSIKTKTPDLCIVVVHYQFEYGIFQEWYLELFSRDGHWVSMSPYFGKKPDLSQGQEKWLWDLPPNTELEVKEVFPDFRAKNSEDTTSDEREE